MKIVFRGKLLTESKKLYNQYVFQNLAEKYNSKFHYICTVECPNWTGVKPKIGETGFVECEYTTAGEEYTDHNGQKRKYAYTNCYFMKFIKEKDNLENFRI